MKRMWRLVSAIFVCVLFGFVQQGRCLQPSGWVYTQYPYIYTQSSGSWYYINESDIQWVNRLSTQSWRTFNTIEQGWHCFAWPYSYSVTAGSWCYWNEVDTQWCCNMTLGAWSLFGQSPAPTGMVLIPAGSFQMGDSLNEGFYWERPMHSVYVSAFYMDRYEVTKAKWDEVYSWALSNGYSFDSSGWGKAANHPVHSVTWYDAAKWCNARSQKEGRIPCYTVAGSVYKTGRTRPDCNWYSSGYRLPTEAEWEKAARGGLSGQRFPWGGSINHGYANYSACGSDFDYDTSPYTDYTYHPDYNDGVYPYTSPVGVFTANGYGLYDMTGNLSEWCWDLYDMDYYSSSPGSDPHGPSSGLNRVCRGGSWYAIASFCRVATRDDGAASYGGIKTGFRAVLRAQ